MNTFGARPLNRPDPVLPVTKMVTHAILQPLSTHWRPATCAEIQCEHYTSGWGLNTAGLPEQTIALAKNAGRKFIVEHDENGAEVLLFEAGQSCFRAAEHRKLVDREPLFVSRSGDWRGNPDGPSARPRVFSGAEAWKDSIGTTLDRCQG
jgi:hypothetical protein